MGVTTDMRATESARAGDVFAAQDCTRQDALFIAAANPAAVLGLLDSLAHMTEARDNARAEVERLTALVEAVPEYASLRPEYASHATPDLAKPGALWTQAIYDRIVYDLAVGGER